MNFCKLSITRCQSEEDKDEYITFLQELTERLGIDVDDETAEESKGPSLQGSNSLGTSLEGMA